MFPIEERAKLITNLANTLTLNPENLALHPMEDKELDETVGLVYINTCDPEHTPPGSALMVTFSRPEYNVLPLSTIMASDYVLIDDEDVQRTLNLFGSYPDRQVAAQLLFLTKELLRDGFGMRSIPYRDAAPILASDLDIDKVEGSLYPILFFYSQAKEETVVAVASPIIFNKEEATIKPEPEKQIEEVKDESPTE